MEIIQLAAGQVASEACDCVQIQELPNGRFDLAASVLLQRGKDDEFESVSITSGASYASYEHAEAAGLAWALQHRVDQIYVVRSKGTEQLQDIFDLPGA